MEFTKPCQFSALTLNSLRLKVRLGCSAEERSTDQYVRFDVEIRFPHLPKGCWSDSLSESICYAQLSDTIKRICHLKEYQLIEKLGWDAFSAVKETLPQEVQLWVKVIKEKPPVIDLEGGASFCVGDWQ